MTESPRQLRTNSRGNTRLLVSIPLADRDRLAEASRLSGKSQQSIIRCGLVQIVDSILSHPAAKETAKKRGRKPARNGKGGAA
jgi:hypothetical protein